MTTTADEITVTVEVAIRTSNNLDFQPIFI